MQGLLQADGVWVCEQYVGRSLGRVAPQAQRARSTLARRMLNSLFRIPPSTLERSCTWIKMKNLYILGLHMCWPLMDIAERWSASYHSPSRTAIEIYARLFRPLLLQTGLWDQVRCDGGREFDLLLSVQAELSHFRRNVEKPPYRRTQSIHNLRAERFWCNVNQRVNYPTESSTL